MTETVGAPPPPPSAPLNGGLPWYKSRTVWSGIVATVLSLSLGLFKLDLAKETGLTGDQLVDLLLTASTVAATVASVVFRVLARHRVGVPGVAAPPPAG